MCRVDAAALGFRLGSDKGLDLCATGERGVPPPLDNISIIDAGEIAQPFIFSSAIRKTEKKNPFVGRLLLVWLCTYYLLHTTHTAEY